MSNIVPFQFESHQIRTVTDEQGEPWFVAVDVCKGLGIANTSCALSRLDDDERRVVDFASIVSNQGIDPCHKINLINKSGLYSLVLGSRKQAAKVAIDLLVSQVSDYSKIIDALSSFEIPDDLPDMFVYAIREKDTGNVKLGISHDPEQRLRQLQIGNSSELELVAYRKAENRFADERAIHADADAYRLRGEWFSAGAAEVLQ